MLDDLPAQGVLHHEDRKLFGLFHLHRYPLGRATALATLRELPRATLPVGGSENHRAAALVSLAYSAAFP